MKLTDANRRILKAADKHPLGLAPELGTKDGFGSASRRRMMNRLIIAGFFRSYVHGGYEITDVGRAFIRSHETSPMGNGDVR